MKTFLKTIAIILGIILGMFFLFYVVIVISFHDTRDLYTEEITTEYGDEFIFKKDFQGKWFVRQKNSGRDFRISFFNENTAIIGICNTSELRSYIIGNESVIFCRADSEKFQIIISDDLYSNEDMVPVIKSILFRNNNILKKFLPYFLDQYPEETEEMLRTFLNSKYDSLSEYGLTDDVIANNDELHSMKTTARKSLKS